MPQRNKTYAGANGNKISVIYQGEQYMLKARTYQKQGHELLQTGWINQSNRFYFIKVRQ